MVVYWPGITDKAERKSCDALLYNIDYGPTLCELLDLPTPELWQGESFAAAIRGEEIPSRDYLVLGQGAHTFQRSVRTRDHLYTRTYHPGANRTDLESLFNVTDDPHLEHNIIDKDPDLAARMRSHLLDWWHFYAASPGALPDPMQIAMQHGPTLYTKPAEYANHLRNTGRDDQARMLEESLRPRNGAVPVSWHASQPLQSLHFGAPTDH